MEVILATVILILSVMYISTKLGLTAYVAWMEENQFRQPSDEDLQRLIRWCAKKYLEDLFGKS